MWSQTEELQRHAGSNSRQLYNFLAVIDFKYLQTDTNNTNNMRIEIRLRHSATNKSCFEKIIEV